MILSLAIDDFESSDIVLNQYVGGTIRIFSYPTTVLHEVSIFPHTRCRIVCEIGEHREKRSKQISNEISELPTY